jgi:glycosyltransferase involved in cell wall biosynthesis
VTNPGSPKVSIGMPVYNGARYLRPVIASHLSQTFTDFELIICDDASTDDTRTICEEFARTDPRIRYVPNAENRGATRNFNRTFEFARCEYFKWSAQDDLLEPEFLEKCVEVLETRADVVLCHSLCKIVDLTPLDQGEVAASGLPVLVTYDLRKYRTDADQATSRFGARIKGGRCTELFGVIRRDAVGRINRAGRAPLRPEEETGVVAPFQPFVGADRAILAELVIDGKFACVPEYNFYNGEHSARGSARGRSPLERLAFYRPSNRGADRFRSVRCSRPTWTSCVVGSRREPSKCAATGTCSGLCSRATTSSGWGSSW